VLQKTQVFYIYNNFSGPFWSVLANFGHFWALKVVLISFGLIFWQKNDWGHALGKNWGWCDAKNRSF
jgi:hypothetical protein